MFIDVASTATNMTRGHGRCRQGERLRVFERRVCRMLGQHRSTQRKRPCEANDEQALTEDIVTLALLRDWIVSMSRRASLKWVAHLIGELWLRARNVGLTIVE